MSQKTFNTTAAVIFTLVFVLHGLRVIRGWEAVIGGFMVPMWASYLAVVIAGVMAYFGWKKCHQS